MKKALPTVLASTVLMMNVGTAYADLDDAIQDGGDRIDELQHTDGKWGWPLTAPPTYTNIQGPIGQGVLNAYGHTGDLNHLNSATAAGDALVGLSGSWVGSYNPMFLIDLHTATGNTDYLTQATSFFTELNAGTYTTSGSDYDTAGFIARVESGRSGAWSNLKPWEFAPLAYAADAVGTASQRTAFVDAIKDSIDDLDSSDPGTVYSDIIGLSGGVMGLNWLNEDFDPTAGSFASADNTDDLADILAGLQNGNGSWYWHSNLVAPAAGDEDRQATAYAMLALLAANDSGQYDAEILLGRDYLVSSQMLNGGWESYSGGSENAEVDGEIVWALSATASVPEPTSLVLLGFGGLAMMRRRRK